MYAIEAEDLTKEYVTKKGPLFRRRTEVLRAVDTVSFGIREGEIFSLLGPNGAGKTTIIKMLATLLIPTSGRATVHGLDVVKQELAVRRLLTAVLPGERTLFWKLTVAENLRYFGALYGLKRSYVEEQTTRLLAFFALEDKRDSLVERLSTGQRQKVVLSRALLPDPAVILLDEPTLGLDPAAAKSLRQLIQAIKAQGKTILLTTHYMYEADELSDRVAIIDNGSIVCLDTPSRLKAGLEATKVLRWTTDYWSDELSEEFSRLHGGVAVSFDRKEDQFRVSLRLQDGEVALEQVSEFGRSRDIPIFTISLEEPSLEDVFIARTGRQMKEEPRGDAVLA